MLSQKYKMQKKTKFVLFVSFAVDLLGGGVWEEQRFLVQGGSRTRDLRTIGHWRKQLRRHTDDCANQTRWISQELFEIYLYTVRVSFVLNSGLFDTFLVTKVAPAHSHRLLTVEEGLLIIVRGWGMRRAKIFSSGRESNPRPKNDRSLEKTTASSYWRLR